MGVAEKERRRSLTSDAVLDVAGFCPVCETETRFVSDSAWLRDHFICIHCHSAPRERALIAVLDMYFPEWRGLAIHESSPALRASAKLRAECARYTASQYDPALGFGVVDPARGYRSEDLEAQTFADASFDLVVTQDVFEHLFRPDRAIAEIARTLKPGGAHVCTFPIGERSKPSKRRARKLPDGSIEHLMEPIYHGNPMDEAGSLVTIEYGYDVADYFDRHSGLSTTMVYIDDLSRGIRAEFIEVLVSRKGAGPSLLDSVESEPGVSRRRRGLNALMKTAYLRGRRTLGMVYRGIRGRHK
jgi:SAM-dependent methyltransferase